MGDFDSLRRLYPVPDAPPVESATDFPGSLALLLHDLFPGRDTGNMLVIGDPPPCWFDYVLGAFHGNIVLVSSGGVAIGLNPEMEAATAGCLQRYRARVAWCRKGMIDAPLAVAAQEGVAFSACCLYQPVTLGYMDAIQTVRRHGFRPAFIGVGARAVTVRKVIDTICAVTGGRKRLVGESWIIEGGA